MARKFANFFATKLKTDMDATQTNISLETLPRDKDNNLITEGRIVIEARNSDKREIVKYTGIDIPTTSITGCTRGDGRTTATTHSKGAISEVNVTGEDLTEIYDYFDTFTNTYPMKSLYDNAIINAGCMVSQRYDAAPALSTTYQYGKVDRFAAKAAGTAVTAGTIEQTLAPSVVAVGAALKIVAATITGTGIVSIRYRMEAKDAQMFKNLAASFGCLVRQDTGVSINAKVYINKPTAADNFTSVTNVATSGNIAVPHNTNTVVKLENINTGNLGDVSNGIEIVVELACGAVTTKNFEFSNFVFNKGALLAPFMPKRYQEDLAACQRYYLPVRNPAQGYSCFASGFLGSPTFVVPTPTTMRALPTLTFSGLGHRFGGADYSMGSCVPENVNSHGVSFIGSGGGGNGNVTGIWTNVGKFYLDAEL